MYDVISLYGFENNGKCIFATFWQTSGEIRSEFYTLKSSGSTKKGQTSKDSNSTADKSSEAVPSGNKLTIIEYGGGAGSGSAGYEVLAESQSGDTYAQALARFASVLSSMTEEELINTAIIDRYSSTYSDTFIFFNYALRDGNDYIQYTAIEGNSSASLLHKIRIWIGTGAASIFYKILTVQDSNGTRSVTDNTSNAVISSMKLVRLASDR